MSENTPTCQINEKNQYIECDNFALSGDPDGLCILHSKNKGKNPEAFRAALRTRWDQEDQEEYNFRGVFFPGRFDPNDFFGSREFKKQIYFSYATFTEHADFSDTFFTKEGNFSQANFKKEADFSEAIFMGWANFFRATFEYGATFLKASFTNVNFFDATFQRAVFSNAILIEAHFSWAKFKDSVDFHGATFTKEANFSDATFTEGANFSDVTIAGRVFFRALNSPQEGASSPPAFQANFQELQVSPGALLRFQDLSLAQVEFIGSDLRRVEFHHVQWSPYRGRQVIYDEVLLRQEEKKKPWFWTWLLYNVPYADPPSYWTDKYGEVERLYRDLQENYDKSRDYKKMGDFHYGEMEMHRRASKWRWFSFYWYIWLLLLIPAWAGLVWGLGIDQAGSQNSLNYWDTLLFIFEKVTFQRPDWPKGVTWLGKFLGSLSVLLLPGQAALFILALRNRLGRRR